MKLTGITAMRKRKGLSANRLAKMCGVTRQQICNIEKGRSNVSVELAKKLGAVLGTPWTEFFDDEDNSNQAQQS